MLDVSQSDSEAELRGNRKIAAPYRGAVVLVNFDTDQRKPWFIKALRADGQPLTFGYEVNDIHGHNIGVVGREASYLFAPMKYRHRLMWQLISNKGFHAQSPSVKRLMKVKLYLPVIVRWFYGNSHNAIYINDDGYACELCGML